MQQSEILKNKCKRHWERIGIINTEIFKDRIREIFKENDDQAEVLYLIYMLIFPDWDRISIVHGYPEAGNELWKFICREFISFDQTHHPNVFAGGIWMNNGFSSNFNLAPYEISFENCRIEY